MRSLTCTLVLAATAAPLGAGGPPPLALDAAVNLVTAGGTYATVERLASPDFAGRLTGTNGFDAAARWAAEQLHAIGFRPAAESPDFLQRFPVTVGGVESARMELAAPERAVRELRLGREFLPLLFSGSGDASAEVVFVGYGITDPELGRDDYAGVDVRGKIVMAVRGAPKDGREWAAHDSHRARTANARAHQAAGFLFAESAIANPNGEPIADLPMASVGDEIADEILAPRKLNVAELRRVLAQGGVASFASGSTAHLVVKARPAVAAQGANVVAVLPGRDRSAAGEYVLLGAHLDHVGDWPKLNPGADDNASGSATVLEIARAASRLQPRPRRSLVVALFGGEENGLLGSRHYVAHPPASLGRCVAVFNLDMVGVGTGAWVAAGKNFPELFALLEKARDRRESGMEVKAGLSEGEARADHGPFQAAGIPAVSLFGSGGSHHGYHTPDDTIWWITPRTMEGIGRIVLDAAVTAAEASDAGQPSS